jgi:hypothetical protein
MKRHGKSRMRSGLRAWALSSAHCLVFLVACACSDPAASADEALPAASLTFTLSEPDGERTCRAAAPNPYRLGSENDPIDNRTHDANVVCSIHSSDADSWFTGSVAGAESNTGAHVSFDVGNETGLFLRFFFELTDTLAIDPAVVSDSDCVPVFTATVGDAVVAEFDCPLLADPNDATNGCGVSGTVSFENCESSE